MDRLYSPWRSQYIETFKVGAPMTEDCVFCAALHNSDDEKNLVVYRGENAFIIMNLYPYNSGHLMVIPNRHTSEFTSLTEDELSECMKLLKLSQQALTEMSHPHGFNIGMNLGRAAGAGIEGHLHWHLVPRWNGDTNFMPVMADVKLVSEDLHKQRAYLHEYFIKNLSPKE
jgi:ATP adenylyltransferase